MTALLHSLGLFSGGVLKRFWVWTWTLLLDPFEFYNDHIRTWAWTPDGQVDMPSEWFVPLFVGFFILAGGMTYHALRQTTELTSGNEEHPSLQQSIEAFIAEGDTIRAQTVAQGVTFPEALAENWRIRVGVFLEGAFGKVYVSDWTYATLKKPRQGFSGIAPENHVQLWKGISASLDFLNDLRDQI